MVDTSDLRDQVDQWLDRLLGERQDEEHRAGWFAAAAAGFALGLLTSAVAVVAFWYRATTRDL